MYLLLCLFSSAMAVLALSSWAAKQGSGFAVDELTGQITGIGDYRRAVVQAGAAAIGILVAILLSNIDYRSLVNVWPVHVVLTWGLVLPTLVIRNVTIGPLTIGYNAGDTDNYSWYKLGGFTFQPTELAKISFILTFAMHLNNVRSRLNEPKELGKLLLHLFVPIGIIHIQGDDGTAIIYGIIGCCMLFAAGLSWKLLAIAGGILAVAAPIAWLLLPDYLQERFMVAWNPGLDPQGAGMQQYRGQIALGSGQLFGRGLFADGLYNFPARHNDMVFAYIGQTLGFVGCIVVALAITIICVKMLFIAKKSNDDMGLYICCGIFAIWLFQTILNIGMVICVLPVIGVTLPLVSYGGTSVLVSYLSIGLVMSVHRQARRESMFESRSGTSLRK